MTIIIMGFIVCMLLSCYLTIQEISNNYNNVFGQMQGMTDHASGDEKKVAKENPKSQIEKLIPPFTEWTGIFSLGIFAGLFVFKANSRTNTNNQNTQTKIKTRNINIAISILSISVGIIHILLVPEHSNESVVWGITFLISGIAQIGYGVFILMVKNHSLRKILYYIGIVGNALLAITFILVRLITPPFSPEQSPINELEPNGILTMIIEVVLVILLIYQLKHMHNIKENIKQI